MTGLMDPNRRENNGKPELRVWSMCKQNGGGRD